MSSQVFVPREIHTVRSISTIRRASRVEGGKEDEADHVDDELLGKPEDLTRSDEVRWEDELAQVRGVSDSQIRQL